MSAPVPSPPLDASSTQRGLVNTLAQTFANVKTFLGVIVASAGVQVASLFNTNGSGASDVAVKVGTTLADASVNAAAKLFSIRTGLGGSEVESLAFYKGGTIGGGAGLLIMSGTVGSKLSYNGAVVGLNEFVANQVAIRSSLGASATDVLNLIGSSTADASVNAAAKLVSFGTGIGGTYVEKAYHRKSGALVVLDAGGTGNHLGVGNATDLSNVAPGLKYDSGSANIGIYNANGAAGIFINMGSGLSQCTGAFTAAGTLTGSSLAMSGGLTDVTGTPGSGTINTPKGRAAIASGGTSCTISSSLVTASSVIDVQWEDDPGQRHRVVPGAGTFTVTLSGAAAALSKFRVFIVT